MVPERLVVFFCFFLIFSGNEVETNVITGLVGQRRHTKKGTVAANCGSWVVAPNALRAQFSVGLLPSFPFCRCKIYTVYICEQETTLSSLQNQALKS